MRRVPLAALAAAILLCLSGIAADAANAPDEPDLQAMALAVTDFDGGAAVNHQGFTTPQAPIVAEYERYFKPGAHLAGRRLLYAANIDFSLDDAGTTQLVFTTLVAQLRTSSGRAQITNGLIAAVKKNTGGKVKVQSVSAGLPVPIRAGQGGFRMTIVLRTSVGRIELALTGVRVDRAIGLIALAAYPRSRLTTGPANLATARLAKRFLAGFVLHNTTVPTIVGAPQQGQALTADPGHWAGGPGSFTYQWNRCTAACAPIAGALGQTYVPTAADSSARLSVTVTASNSVSQSTATSNAVGPVP
jgi:hypothetical protein